MLPCLHPGAAGSPALGYLYLPFPRNCSPTSSPNTQISYAQVGTTVIPSLLPLLRSCLPSPRAPLSPSWPLQPYPSTHLPPVELLLTPPLSLTSHFLISTPEVSLGSRLCPRSAHQVSNFLKILTGSLFLYTLSTQLPCKAYRNFLQPNWFFDPLTSLDLNRLTSGQILANLISKFSQIIATSATTQTNDP